jgi:hypothetical protein
MKKFLLVLSIALVFTSCKKNSDDLASVSAKLIGKWKEGAATSIYYYNGIEVYREQLPADATKGYNEFKANSIVSFYNDLGKTTLNQTDGTYTLLNNNTTLHITIQGQTEDYQISFTDNNTINMSAKKDGKVVYTDTKNTDHQADSHSINGVLIRQ